MLRLTLHHAAYAKNKTRHSAGYVRQKTLKIPVN